MTDTAAAAPTTTTTTKPAPGPVELAAARARRARMRQQADQNKMMRELITPEGASLHLRLGTAADRAGAFMIDVAIQWAITIATLLGLSYLIGAFGTGAANIAFTVWIFFFFFLRNFYFIFFELGPKAATPGKRALGLRVAARDGGRLTANSVLARNFIREIEVGLPFQFLLMSASNGVEGWMALLGMVWSGVFLFFPLFNKDKLRVGDLIAGTWVIKAPKAQLMGDIASTAKASADAGGFAFTSAQADAYGIHELHVLEDVLRQSTPQIKGEVADRIRAKIGWQRGPVESNVAFLEAYYGALRRSLEQRMLLGDRKTDKFDTV